MVEDARSYFHVDAYRDAKEVFDSWGSNPGSLRLATLFLLPLRTVRAARNWTSLQLALWAEHTVHSEELKGAVLRYSLNGMVPYLTHFPCSPLVTSLL
jgi:hypothetical protein